MDRSRLGTRTLLTTLAGSLALAVTTLISPAAVAAPVPGAGPERGSKSGQCALIGENLEASVTPAADPQGRFDTLGNTSGQWVGADSTYSVPLGDGRVAWLFSDTLYGQVDNGTLSPNESAFLNNSIVVDDGQSLRTITGGTRNQPQSLIPGSHDAWSWFGAGTRQPNGNLQVMVLNFVRTGPGLFDFRWDSNSVATIDPRTWQVSELEAVPSAQTIQWGSWLQRQPGATLVYGVEDLGSVKYQHLARVRGNDLSRASAWEYWTGTRWSRNESDSARMLDGVANEYSVTPYGDGWLLITQDTREPLSARILAYRSCSPTGPFTSPVELYRTPETGASGSYQNPNIFTYNAHEHPELRTGNSLLISYNVNSFNPDELYRDVTIYRPRFIRVTLNPAG
ncbi:uncharacterized protein DUF4185 [Enemella evansiae]|nr:uncharacterized protein DUF4185 [Enemella evansiae]